MNKIEDDVYTETPIAASLMMQLNQLEPEVRDKEVKDIIWRLQFEQRVAALTDDESASAFLTDVSESTQARIDALSGTERDEYCDKVAKAIYMRQCVWMDYLKGVEPEKPYLRSPHESVR